jgi:hypothetical protein
MAGCGSSEETDEFEVSCEENSLRWQSQNDTGVQECEYLCQRCSAGPFPEAVCKPGAGYAYCECVAGTVMTVCPNDPDKTQGCDRTSCP